MRLRIFLIFLITLIGINYYPDHKAAQAQDLTQSLVTVNWSPTGTMVATGHYDSKARIWDTNTNQLLHTLSGHTGYISSLAWSPDETLVAAGSVDETVKVWNVSTGVELFTLSGHTSTIGAIAWSLDGTEIITISLNGLENLRIYNSNTGALISTSRIGSGISANWSPDGTVLAVTNLVGTVQFLDAENLQIAGSVEIPNWQEGIAGVDFYAMAWRPNGDHIATGSLDGTVRIWDINTQTMLLELQGNDSTEIAFDKSAVVGLRFSQSGNTLMAVSTNGTVRIWDASTGEVLQTAQLGSSLYDAELSPDGFELAYGFLSYDGEPEVICVGQWEIPVDRTVPTMIAPCGTVSDSIWPTYSWWAADNADWYLIYVRDLPGNTIHPFGAAGLWVEAAQVCNGDICEYRPVDYLRDVSPAPPEHYFSLRDGNYEWSLRAYDSTTDTLTDWQPDQGFEVVNPVPTPLSPIDSSVTGFPTYTWAAVPDANMYQLIVKIKQTGQAIVVKWFEADDVCEGAICQYQSREQGHYLYAHLNNGQYEWFVQSYHLGPNVYGAWQNAEILVGAQTSETPIVESSTLMVDMTGRHELSLTWEQGANADFYKVWVGDAAQQAIDTIGWFYHADVCVEEICTVTVYFEGDGRVVALAALNPATEIVWGPIHQLTVVEPTEELVVGEPPSVFTADGFDGDSMTPDDITLPEATLAPVQPQIYPEICGDNPLCDSPFGEE